jgi:4-hydroxybenzoyl-CoA reductase subunit beta
MNLPHFIYHAPHTLEESVDLVTELRDDGAIIAGGTDLLVRMKYRLSQPRHLVSLSKINELKRIEYYPGQGLSIGAATSLTRLALDPIVRERCPALSRASELVATKQVRNTATIGGNVLQNTRCRYYNRSPVWGKAIEPCFKRNGNVCHAALNSKRCFAVYQGDLAPLLITLHAYVRMASLKETEEITVESLFSGNGKEPFLDLTGKVMQNVIIPESSLFMNSDYKKYRIRNGIDYPLAGVAASVKNIRNGMGSLRICLTAVSSSPVLVSVTEDMVHGKSSGKELFKEIGKKAHAAAHPLANLEDDPAKRCLMIRLMTEDILAAIIS